MTYNVFRGMLNFAQPTLVTLIFCGLAV